MHLYRSHGNRSTPVSKACTLLRIDEESTVEAIAAYMQNLYNRHSARGVLIGLSGGIDSAFLATLAVHTFGKDAVHAAYLYDRDSERVLALNARRMVDWLGIELEAQSIEPEMRARGIYAPLIMRSRRLSQYLNRFIHRFYCLVLGETPFLSSLRAGNDEIANHRLRRIILGSIGRHAETGFYTRHRYRREWLE